MPQREPSPAPPNPDDVLAYWRWFYERIMWPAAPKRFQQFWRSVESCEILQLLCTPGVYDPVWLHALIYHLGEMWQAAKDKPKTQRTGRKGRPQHLRSSEPMEDPLLRLCILDLIVMGLLGSTDVKGRPPKHTKHWKVSADLLQYFFPEKYHDTWDRTNLKGSVNQHLREHRRLVLEGFTRVDKRVSSLISDEYRQHIQAHLSR